MPRPTSRPRRSLRGGRSPTLLGAAVALTCLAWPSASSAQVANGAIVFSAKRAGDRALFTRAPDGSGLRLIQTGGRADHAAFSPGGRRLAFTKYGPLGAQIWVSYVEGTGLRQLTTGPSDTMPAWAPGGADLVFARGAGGSRDLYTVKADGTSLRRLTTSARNDDSPSWSVRNEIAFVRAGRGGGDDIYVIGGQGGLRAGCRAARRMTARPPGRRPAAPSSSLAESQAAATSTSCAPTARSRAG